MDQNKYKESVAPKQESLPLVLLFLCVHFPLLPDTAEPLLGTM
jgi:hypothetical protein